MFCFMDILSLFSFMVLICWKNKVMAIFGGKFDVLSCRENVPEA